MISRNPKLKDLFKRITIRQAVSGGGVIGVNSSSTQLMGRFASDAQKRSHLATSKGTHGRSPIVLPLNVNLSNLHQPGQILPLSLHQW